MPAQNKKDKKIAKPRKKKKAETEQEQYDEVVDEVVSGKGDVNVGEILERIVKTALEQQSSDVHIEPREDSIIVRFRIDGSLRDVMKIDKALEQALVFKVKVTSRLRTDEHFAPQDGKIRFVFDGQKLDTRVSILPTTKGEKIVMRLLSSAGKSFALENLGFRDRELELIQKAYQKPYGMIIAAGPTGSGKTTTLYSILKLLNKPDVNISTIEDPVEYDIDGVNHVQVHRKADMTFASGLRSLLRQDPDIIMIGEIRDNETAKIATNSAMTGHLVLSTIHTNDSVTTVPRLIEMGVEKFVVASTMNVVIAQRLAKRLCVECKAAHKLTQAEIDEVKIARPDIAGLFKVGDTVHKSPGCEACKGSGYKGRVGLYEVLEVTKEIRDVIMQKSSSADDVLKVALTQGLTLIVEDGVDKVKEGLTDIEEVIKVTALRD
jgi:type IV pilus assembly protein PilB